MSRKSYKKINKNVSLFKVVFKNLFLEREFGQLNLFNQQFVLRWNNQRSWNRLGVACQRRRKEGSYQIDQICKSKKNVKFRVVSRQKVVSANDLYGKSCKTLWHVNCTREVSYWCWIENIWHTSWADSIKFG